MKIVKLIFIVLFVSSTLVNAGIKKTEKGVEFFWEDPDAEEVFLVGSFNDWKTSADKMKKDENGVWHKTMNLSPGEHSYKYFVDGNWVVDSDNPKTKSDGYGGTNSLVVVEESGKVSTGKAKPAESVVPKSVKTTLNPKVTFNGRYYSKAITKRNDIGRYMLNKPNHDVNLQINFDLNQNMKAYTVMNINNIKENVDMGKTHLNFKRTNLELTTKYFTVQAFDRIGGIRFNDPLHIIGDIGQCHYGFGYDQTGVYAKSGIPSINLPFTQKNMHLKLYGLISDESGDNDTDVKSGRTTIETEIMENSNLLLGYSAYICQLPLDGSSCQENVSNEADFNYIYELDNPGWESSMKFDLMGEYYSFENNDVDSVTTNWMDGNTSYFGLAVDFPAALKVRSSYKNIYINLTEELSRDNFMLGADFNLGNFLAKVDMNFWSNDFPDSSFAWSDYYKYIEKTEGNGRWYQKYSDLTYDRYTLLGYDTGMLWNLSFSYKNKFLNKDYKVEYESNIAQREMSKNPRFVENLLILQYDFAQDWRFYLNTRIPYYNAPFLGVKTDLGEDENVFASTFAQLTYYLRDNIELSLGWGVNPRVLNSTTDEFYNGGRDEYLEQQGDLTNYLQNNYKGLGEKLKQAESSLEDANRIGLEAVLKF